MDSEEQPALSCPAKAQDTKPLIVAATLVLSRSGPSLDVLVPASIQGAASDGGEASTSQGDGVGHGRVAPSRRSVVSQVPLPLVQEPLRQLRQVRLTNVAVHRPCCVATSTSCGSSS